MKYSNLKSHSYSQYFMNNIVMIWTMLDFLNCLTIVVRYLDILPQGLEILTMHLQHYKDESEL